MDSLQPNLEGADRARSSEVCVCMCAYVSVSVHAVCVVHIYASCVDVSVLHSSAVEVNEQVQVSSVLTCSYRCNTLLCLSSSRTVSLPNASTSSSHQSNTCQIWRDRGRTLCPFVCLHSHIALGGVQGEMKMPYRFGKTSERKIERVNVALECVSGVSTLQGCKNNIASNTQTSDPLEGALF